MRQWPDLPLQAASLVFFDLETTALRPDRGGRICEMAVIGPDGILFDWTSSQNRPEDQILGHQISSLSDVLRDSVVVGHNLQFDFQFLSYEAQRLERDGFDIRFIDTLGLARKLIPDHDDYQLGHLLSTFDANPDEELHTAIGDALATRTLFWRLVNESDLKTLSDAGMKRVSWNVR